MKELFDLSELVSGKATPESFTRGLDSVDLARFDGKIVQVKGCVPTWAYMMAVHRLEGIAAGVEFVLFDGSVVPVYAKQAVTA